MKITVLDKKTMGDDISFAPVERYGELTAYDISPAELIPERVADAEVIILNKAKITADVIAAAKNLKLICVFATGYDNIDLTAAREAEVAVCNVPGYSTDSVTLYTIATVTSLASRLMTYRAAVSSGEYTVVGSPNKISPAFNDLRGKTWGIIGYGNIGKSVAEVAKAFGANVIVNKRTPTDDAICVDVDTLCEKSDIITIHCPLNDDTRGMINADRLALMKKSVILVNEARGAVLDESAVAKAVENGDIAAFGCDVYTKEPFPADHPYTAIKDLDNVILTPHSAWASYEARTRCVDIISNNIASYINGDKLNRVD
jgi:glycerate dehydrogenase